MLAPDLAYTMTEVRYRRWASFYLLKYLTLHFFILFISHVQFYNYIMIIQTNLHRFPAPLYNMESQSYTDVELMQTTHISRHSELISISTFWTFLGIKKINYNLKIFPRQRSQSIVLAVTDPISLLSRL